MRHLSLLISAYLAFAANNFGPLDLDKNLWLEFKQNHSKTYENEQVEELRKAVFAKNVHEIRTFNEQADEAQYFELGINHLADMSSLDMKQLNGFQLPRNEDGQVDRQKLRNTPEAERFLQAILDDQSIEVPDELDWRQVAGRVSDVKNQGQCGSCWAFASTGALEGQEVARGVLSKSNASKLVELSEQNLVDCVKADAGCNGGLMADAFDFIKTEGGIDSEQSYPYEARTGKCRFDKAKSVLTDGGHVILPEGDEQKLKEAVAKFGPVAVAIDASSIWFQLYRKGVYINKHCGHKEDSLDHGVLVVGYGTDPRKGDYWLVKNSWGAHWGEKGYIKMARNRNNQCGIATQATLPTF